ncbi:DUF2232 domain-containing protein [Phreatobacter sp.]|uniref:DUF2232 domain-containing protein n=1 Tax=Phreatobacter sp. TaxID=1966341 RepID=UPI003F722C71
MGPTLATAFGAGIASAFLFSTLASGSPLALVLFYFAALPVLIVGLGWGHYAGAFASTIGALALSLALRSQLGVFFFFSIGLPAWILTYLALSMRVTAAGTEQQEAVWVPPGVILSAIGALAICLTLFGIAVVFGLDFDTYQASLRQSVERTLRLMNLSNVDPAALATFMAAALPLAAGIVWTFVTTLNLFIAGRVVRASGRLARPWPDLPALRLPKWTAGALLFGSLASFAPGLLGHVGMIVLAVGLTINALAGFALLHDLTRGWSARGFALGLLYAVTFVIGWPMIFVALAGLADVLFDIRARRSPPTPPANS